MWVEERLVWTPKQGGGRGREMEKRVRRGGGVR